MSDLPAKDDWEYLGKWVARKLEMDEGCSIYDVMGQMHCLASDARMARNFVARQRVVPEQHERAELEHLREVVLRLNND